MMTSSIRWLATLTPAHLVPCYRDTLTAISRTLRTESRIRQTGAFRPKSRFFIRSFLILRICLGVFSFHGNFFKIRQRLKYARKRRIRQKYAKGNRALIFYPNSRFFEKSFDSSCTPTVFNASSLLNIWIWIWMD